MFRYKYNILANGKQLLHADNSSFTPGKPDLTFHSGADKNGPVVSVCKFLHFSRHLKIGLGDPNFPNDVVWEGLTAENLMLNKYRIEMTIGGKRRSFLWKLSVFSHDSKLVDEQTQAVIAMFHSSHFSLKKTGRLEIYKTYGSDFELMVLTSALALAERRRRRESGGAGSGGDGGGGGGNGG